MNDSELIAFCMNRPALQAELFTVPQWELISTGQERLPHAAREYLRTAVRWYRTGLREAIESV